MPIYVAMLVVVAFLPGLIKNTPNAVTLATRTTDKQHLYGNLQRVARLLLAVCSALCTPKSDMIPDENHGGSSVQAGQGTFCAGHSQPRYGI